MVKRRWGERHGRAQLGLNSTWLRGWWEFKIFIMAYSWQRTSCVYTCLLLIATSPSLWNKWRVWNQTHVTNAMYKFTLFIFFFLLFFLPAVLLQGFCHCTSARPRTPIYRAFKRTNSYLQIYLVKPWLISTVFKPTLRLFKGKTLEYLKILHSKKRKEN